MLDRLRSSATWRPAERWGGTPSPTTVFLGIALLGTILALGSAAWVHARNSAIMTDRFEGGASRLTERVQGRLARYAYGLRGLRGAVVAVGEAGLSGAVIRRYAQSRDLDREFPGARGFGYLQRVSPPQEAAFLRAARAERADFRLQQFAHTWDERFVIRYVEPMTRNRQAVGVDVASDPERRAAAVRAMTTGMEAMTAPVTLVQAPGEVERGFLIFLPIFTPDRAIATPDERRAATFGWSYAPLVIDEVLAGLDLEADELDFAIADRSADEAVRFYATVGMGEAAPIGLTTRRQVAVFDRTWEIEVRARPAFRKDFDRPAPAVAGATVLSVCLLGAGLAALHLSARRRTIMAAVQSNRLAAIVENADEAILGKTLDGTITDWNPAAERLFGYAASEAVGRKAVDLIFPPHRRAEERETLAAIGRGESVPSRATLRRRRDGTMLHVLVGVSPIREPGGALVGAATVMRDIGERVANEERVRALNTSLERLVAERTEALRAAAAVQSAILQQATYAIIATDTAGRITVFNSAAERMLGYAASEVIGRATPMLFHDLNEVAERSQRLSAELGERIEPGPDTFVAPERLGRPTVDEWTYLTRDGGRLPVLLSVSEMRSESGLALGYLAIAMDLSERYRHAAEMRAANAGTWSYDFGSGRVRMSGECARQHGLPDAETEIAVEEGWRPLAHPDDVPRVLADLAEAVEVGGSYTTEFRVLLADGGVRWLMALGRVERGREGRTGRVIGLTLDITARKEAELALVEARREAERASRAKGDFLAAMSHEIRTPLNAILGYTGLMLESGRLGPEEWRQATLVRSAGSALLTVVNDILDFSKVEAGAIRLDPQPFSPRDLAQNCVAIIEGLATAKGILLRLEIEPELPALLRGDKARLRQVLLNLLNNAVKFTHAGTVTLRVEHESLEASDERLRFVVTDSGIGIPEGKRGRLFKRFSQVDGSIEREYGGTGLGLAICKTLVELMGGEIGVESTEGVGSTFWFALGLPRAEDEPTAAEPRRGEVGPTGRLLLVEDNLTNQDLARAVLELAGHVVHVVSDGEQALRAAAEGDYDVILMDVQMPGMDGLTATRAIRDLPGNVGAVPIICMSAGVLPAQVQRYREAGMDDHVDKPFYPDTLLATVARWLPNNGGAPGNEAGFDAGIFDALARKVSPERLRQVLTCLEADLAPAFAYPVDRSEDRDRARRDAHALASAAGMAGYTAVTETCRALEAFDEDRVDAEGISGFCIALDAARAAAACARDGVRAQLGVETPGLRDRE